MPNLNLVLVLLMFTTTQANNNNNFYYNGAPTTTQTALTDNKHESMLCLDIRPQHSVNVEQITGRWYGNEIIMHTQDVPGIFRYESCVIIYLNDVTQQMRGASYNYNVHTRSGDFKANSDYVESKYLRLVWSEKDDNLEYTFNYTEQSPGYWQNVGEQRGSLVSLNQYTQFTGSVQVVKAVNDHLVLTFCGHDVRSSIYTIVLSRNARGLKHDELRSIRSLLARRGLSTETIRQVCQSAAGGLPQVSLLMLILLLVVKL